MSASMSSNDLPTRLARGGKLPRFSPRFLKTEIDITKNANDICKN